MEELNPSGAGSGGGGAKTGCAGCLLFPAGMGGLILAFGIWLMTGWSGHEPVVKVLSVILVGFGALIVLAIGALVLIATLLAKAARDAKRDAKGLVYSLKYMINMGRMDGGRRDDVVVEAEEIKAEEVKVDEIKQIEEKKDEGNS